MSGKYRFKTEAEFEKEFGKWWKTKLEEGWTEDMGHLHGLYFNSEEDLYSPEVAYIFCQCNPEKANELKDCDFDWLYEPDMYVQV